MRVAKDLLSLFDFAGAPVPAATTPQRDAPARRPDPAQAEDLTCPRTASRHRSSGLAAAIHRPDLWHADDLPDDDGPTLATGFAPLDAELPGGGWPQGQLVELLVDAPGLGELSLLAPALAHLHAESCAGVWVLPVTDGARTMRSGQAGAPAPYAPALQAAGVDLARCLFVQPATARESWWTLEQSLRTGHLGAVIGWLPDAAGSDGDFRALRRLHLLAAQRRALVMVLRSPRHATAPSPAALRLQLSQHDGRLQVQVLKRRGRPLLEPVTLDVHPLPWRSARLAPPAAAEPVEVPAAVSQAALAQGRAAQREQRWSLKALFSH